MRRNLLLRLAAPAVAVLAAVQAYAVPAKPGVLQYPNADGTTVSVTLHGDEFGHYYLSEDGYPLMPGADHNLYYVTFDNGAPVASDMKASDPAKRTAAEVSFLGKLDRTALAQAVAKTTLDTQAERRAARAPRLKAGATKVSSSGPVTGLINNYPTIGSPNAMVLLVEFTDVKFTTENTHQVFTDMMNKPGFDYQGATGSALDYYIENSNGLFKPNFEVYGPVTVPHGEPYYGASTATAYDTQAWLMVSDAVKVLHEQNPDLDWSRFDNDGDGFVDSIFVIYAGYGENAGAPGWTIWPHSFNLYSQCGIDIEYNGVKIDNYACSNELRGTEGNVLAGIGTFCHEYGHVLGLPDIYSTNSSSSPYPPGDFEVMDRGSYLNNGYTPPQYSCYDKFSLGWLNPRILSGPENVTLKPLSDGEALVIMTEKPEEYFMLENRQQTGWDSYIPGHGMLIWHIDFDQDLWIKNRVNVQNDHQHIDLIEADNLPGNDSRAGDPFPGSSGVRNFTSTSTPAMTTWIGVDPDMPITDIHEVDGLITFKVKSGGERLEAPVATEARDITPTGFIAAWQPVSGAYKYIVDVCEAPAVIPMRSIEVNEAVTAEITDLKPGTLYTYSVRALDGERVSASSNTIEVTTLPATFDMGVVEALPAAETGSDYFLAAWSPVEGAAGYELTAYSKQSVDSKYMTNDFTKDADGVFMPEGWASTSTTLGSLNGYFGEAAPALRLSNNNDRLSVPMFDKEYVNYLGFWCRGNGTGEDATLTIEAYVNNAWTTIASIDPLSRTAVNVELGDVDGALARIPDFARSVRLVFNKTGNGSVFVDDVKIGYGDSYKQIAVPGFNPFDAGTATTARIDGLTALTSYYYTVRAYNADGLYTRPSAEMYVKTADPASVSAVRADALRAYRDGRSLVLVSADSRDFAVWSISGQKVASGQLQPGRPATLDLAPGVYVVSGGNTRIKIVM